MSENYVPEEHEDDSLANVPPLPVQPEAGDNAVRLAKGIVIASVAGAGILLLIASSQTRCLGATRSARLQWEQRQLEIEQALNDEQGDRD